MEKKKKSGEKQSKSHVSEEPKSETSQHTTALNEVNDSVSESSIVLSTNVSSTGYLVSDEALDLESNDTTRQSDCKFDRTVSVPVDADSVRQTVPVYNDEESSLQVGQTARGIAMKKRSQSACKT